MVKWKGTPPSKSFYERSKEKYEQIKDTPCEMHDEEISAEHIDGRKKPLYSDSTMRKPHFKGQPWKQQEPVSDKEFTESEQWKWGKGDVHRKDLLPHERENIEKSGHYERERFGRQIKRGKFGIGYAGTERRTSTWYDPYGEQSGEGV